MTSEYKIKRRETHHHIKNFTFGKTTTKGFLDCINRIRQKTLSHLSSFYGRVTLVMKEMGSMLDCRLHVT